MTMIIHIHDSNTSNEGLVFPPRLGKFTVPLSKLNNPKTVSLSPN